LPPTEVEFIFSLQVIKFGYALFDKELEKRTKI
jgi:hypothetical protein